MNSLSAAVLALALLIPCACPAQRVWHEAEDIRGNSSAVVDYNAPVSAASYVTGGRWYRLVHIPAPKAAPVDHVWARLRADTDTSIAMLDDSDDPLCWRTVAGGPDWQWIDFGPLGTGGARVDLMPSTPGAVHVDVVVLTNETDPGAFELRQAALEPGLHSSVWPQEAHGNTLYIAQGTAQHFYIVPANHDRKPRPTWSLTLNVPPAFRILPTAGRNTAGLFARYTPSSHTRSRVDRDARELVRHEFAFDRPLPFRPLPTVKSVDCVLLFVEARDAKPGAHRFYYHLDGEPEQALDVEVLPPLRGKQPAATDLCLFTWYLPNGSPAERQAMIETWRQAGINFAQVSGLNDRSVEVGEALHQAGLRVIGNLWWFWWAPQYLKEHPQHAAIGSDGQRAGSEAQRMVCPSVLLTPGNPAMERFLQSRITGSIQGGLFDGMGWDAEGPGVSRACFCDRCLEGFREEYGMAEVTRASVADEHRDQWIDYCCGQTARMLALMRAAAHAARPGARMFAYSGRPLPATREQYRVDWATARGAVDGAMLCFYTHAPGALSQVPKWVDESRAAFPGAPGAVPLWAALSTGDLRSPSGSYMAEAGLLKLQVLKALALGMDGSYLWWWGPMDGRHYHALADASRLISAREDWFIAARATHPKAVEFRDDQWSAVTWRSEDTEIMMLFNHSASAPREATLSGAGLAGNDPRPWTDAESGVALSAEDAIVLPPLGCRLLSRPAAGP